MSFVPDEAAGQGAIQRHCRRRGAFGETTRRRGSGASGGGARPGVRRRSLRLGRGRAVIYHHFRFGIRDFGLVNSCQQC